MRKRHVRPPIGIGWRIDKQIVVQADQAGRSRDIWVGCDELWGTAIDVDPCIGMVLRYDGIEPAYAIKVVFQHEEMSHQANSALDFWLK